MSDRIDIQSYKGPYSVFFLPTVQSAFEQLLQNKQKYFIVDKNVFRIYESYLTPFAEQMVLIDANEDTKSLHAMTDIITTLAAKGMRRDHRLVAVGGGITQDITSFLSATLYRGVDWSFIPTTLLAQADSCIGSKSSINVAGYKNIIGTFNPPEQILICTDFLNTLNKVDLYSGIGEIIKVHMIDSTRSFKEVEKNYADFFTKRAVLVEFIKKSLLIKKRIIEADEFDKNIRNILNYGHSFGHAIESATNFAIPHGIAVTMGMDMANFVSYKLDKWSREQFQEHQPLLKANSIQFYKYPIDFGKFIEALAQDKKNSSSHLNLILPTADASLEKSPVLSDEVFQSACKEYLNEFRMAAQ